MITRIKVQQLILIMAIWKLRIHVKYTLLLDISRFIFIRQVVLASLSVFFLSVAGASRGDKSYSLGAHWSTLLEISLDIYQAWWVQVARFFKFFGSEFFESRFYSRITESNRSFSTWPCSGRCVPSHTAAGETTSGCAYATVAALTNATIAHITRLPSRCHSGDVLKQNNYN